MSLAVRLNFLADLVKDFTSVLKSLRWTIFVKWLMI